MIEFGEGVRPSMALELNAQPGQAHHAGLTPLNLLTLSSEGPSWWVRLNGRLLAIGGYVIPWPDRAVLWGYLGDDARPAMLEMTREVRRQLDRAGVPRYEAYAEVRHKPGRRWLQLLGFRKEGTMKKFIAGRDYVMFAKVS